MRRTRKTHTMNIIAIATCVRQSFSLNSSTRSMIEMKAAIAMYIQYSTVSPYKIAFAMSFAKTRISRAHSIANRMTGTLCRRILKWFLSFSIWAA